MTTRLRAAIEECVVPWFHVPGDVDLDEGTMRRCLLCGRVSDIVPKPTDSAVVTHEPDCAFVAALAAAEAAGPEPIDSRRLARALHDALPCAHDSFHEERHRTDALDIADAYRGER